MSDTIFDNIPDQGNVVESSQTAVAPVTSTVPPEVAELVGAGKKYATVEAAIAALPHAQTHISKLESELAALREDLTKRQTTQELLDALKSTGTQNVATTTKEVNQDDIEKLVEQVVTKKEARKVADTNVNTVIAKFTEVYGADKARDQFLKISQESGIPLSELNRLASISPSVIYKIAGIETRSANTIPGKTTSTVNTQTSQVEGEISAAVKGTSTRDLVDAWKRAGEKVRLKHG